MSEDTKESRAKLYTLERDLKLKERWQAMWEEIIFFL